MHALIVGGYGVGKSFLIQKVLQELDLPVVGFETKKGPVAEDTAAGTPIYLHPAGQPRVQSEDNLVGRSARKLLEVHPEVFDRFAPHLRQPVPEGHLVLLDELGVMESSSPAFREAVLTLLDGGTPIIAAVKHKDTPFLNAVRSHPNCRCFQITEENRDVLFGEVLAFMKDQLSAP